MSHTPEVMSRIAEATVYAAAYRAAFEYVKDPALAARAGTAAVKDFRKC